MPPPKEHCQLNKPQGQRMKARLGRLQARVDYHERTRLQNLDKGDNPPDAGMTDPYANTYLPTPTTEAESLSMKAAKKPIAPQPQPQLPQPNFYEGEMDEESKTLFLQPSQLMNSPPPSESLPHSNSPLLDWNYRPVRGPEKMILDYPPPPKQMLNNRKKQQEDTNYLNFDAQSNNSSNSG